MLLTAVGITLAGLAAGFAFASYQLSRIRRFVAGTTESYPIARLTALQHDAGGHAFPRAVEIAGRVVTEGRSEQPFELEDGTGRVLVDPLGSEPFGAVKDHADEEWALPVGIRVSVRGEASDRGGELVVHQPSDGSVFVIAAESQAGLAKALDSAFRHRLPLCVTMGLVGAVLIVVGLAIG